MGYLATQRHAFQVEYHAAADRRSEKIAERRLAGRDVVIDWRRAYGGDSETGSGVVNQTRPAKPSLVGCIYAPFRAVHECTLQLL